MAASAGSLISPVAANFSGNRRDGVRWGLFFDPDRIGEIRRHYLENEVFAELRSTHAAFDYAGESAWMDNELRYNDQLIGLRRLGGLAEELAFIALMTGEKRAVDLAKRVIREIMKFERWDFFLDGDLPIAVQRASHTTGAVCVAIDFLGNHVDSAERREWLTTMRERGCEACYRSIEDIRNPQSVTGWRFDPESTFFEHRPNNKTDMNRRPEITFNTNLRAIPASALLIGAKIIELEFGKSKETGRFMEMGLWGVEGFREFFKKDGSYNEEVHYANYTAIHILQAVIALRRHGGPDLTDLIDWDAHIDFQLNMSMPTETDPYGVVNWGDSGNPPGRLKSVQRTALPFWVAQETGNSLAQGFALTLAGKHNHWSAVWMDPAIEPKLPAEKPRLWVSELDRVVARTGFRKEHLVVAMRSGPPANHEHADRNSIIVKCFGEELVADPLRPPYSYSDPAWKLRLMNGHSGILVDGKSHEHHNGIEGTNASRSYARIVEHHDTPKYATWISDGTQPYRLVDTDIKSVVRSVGVLYGLPAVVVVDQISKWEQTSAIEARFFGYNIDGKLRMSAAENTFTIERPNAAIRGHVFSNAATTCTADGMLDIEPQELKERHRFAAVQTESTREVLIVTVLTPIPAGERFPKVNCHQNGNRFKLDIGGESLSVVDGRIEIG
jgi:hypothetical protein